ncbi:hypothetical protein HUJ04_001799 [Dendroctonus ponderosae]|nr:hypothetical protein HUJ04_001799 [Dendroctonus ponderosae]
MDPYTIMENNTDITDMPETVEDYRKYINWPFLTAEIPKITADLNTRFYPLSGLRSENSAYLLKQQHRKHRKT